MRKISQLFTLLLLIVGAVSAYAQTPTADPITDEEVPDGYYFIASTQSTIDNVTNPYIAANGGTMKLVSQSDVTTDASTSQVGLWYIRKTGTDGSDNHSTFSIQSMEGNKYYWGVGGNCPLQTTVGIYRIGKDDSGYYFYGNGTTGNITNTDYVNATSATVFGRNTSGANNKWKLIPAGVKNITLNYTAGSRSFSKTKLAGIGKEASTSFTADFYDSFEPSTVNVASDVDAYSVVCTTSFPFVEGKYYKMKIRWANDNDNNDLNVKSDGVYTYRSISWDGNVNSNITTRNAESEGNGALWCVKPVAGTTNQVYLCSAVGGCVLTIANTSNKTMAKMTLNAGTPFECKKKANNTDANYNNGFRLAALTDDNINLNDISGTLGYWAPGSQGRSDQDAGSTFTIYEPSAQPIAVTEVKATNTTTNEAITFDADNSLYVVSTQTTGNVVVKGNSFFTIDDSNSSFDGTTLSVNYTSNDAPYVLSGTTDDTRHWQAIRSRNDNSHYLKLSGDNVASGPNKSAGNVNRSSLSAIKTFNATDEVQWAIVPADGGFDRFYLVNKANATKKAYLASETQGTLVTFTDKGTPFYLAAQPTFDGYTGGFTIQPNNSDTHAVGDHCSDNLGYWSSRGSSELADAGSIFHADLLADCKAIVDAQTNNGYVGSLATSVSTTLNALNGNGDQASITAYLEKYDELLASNDSYVTPETDALYRITFNRCNAVAAATNAVADAEGNVQNGSGDSPQERLLALIRNTVNTPSALVRFHQSGDNYTIEDVNSGYYYGFHYNDASARMFLVPSTNQKGQFAIVNNFSGTLPYVGLKETSVRDDSKRFLWSCGSYESEVFDNYPYVRFHSGVSANSTVAEAGCVLSIQKVTTYPVSISAARFASLCLPFSVTLPESGLTAYKVTAINRDNNNEMNLEEVGSTIPAGEPVILEGDGDKDSYTLTINTENGTRVTGNILTGATVKRTGISEEYYALAKKTIDETETTAFFRVETHNMPANKAYLLKKDIPAEAANAAMFMFNFDGNGGEVTGINTATKAEAESNVYYDLNGRRVLYPSHGIYVKGNGQKVFIK